MNNHLLTQNEMSERTVKNIIVSGNINFQRRKNDGKQVVISSENSKQPLRSLSRIKYLFEKYEKKTGSNPARKTYPGNSIGEQTPKL